MEATTPENSPETATAVAVGPGEESNPGINVQQIPAGPPRLQLKLTNPDGPVRYIPIHIWYALRDLSAREHPILRSFFPPLFQA